MRLVSGLAYLEAEGACVEGVVEHGLSPLPAHHTAHINDLPRPWNDSIEIAGRHRKSEPRLSCQQPHEQIHKLIDVLRLRRT